MGHTKVTSLPPGMASNPYNSMRQQVPLKTLCELCDRTINTRDWPQHKNSKKHRSLENAEKAKENVKVSGNDSGWGDDASGFTPDGDFTLASVDAGNDGWASSNTSGWGASGGSANGSANRTGGGGGDRACFGCGEVGHTKRECPKGGSGGGGQTCYNCGMEGYVFSLVDQTLLTLLQSPQDGVY